MDSEQARSEILVPASAEETWEALTDPERLREWLADDVTELDLRPGGDLGLELDDAQRRGFFEEVDEPRRLVFWWGEDGEESSRVQIDLEPDTEGTRVRVLETRPLEVLDLPGIELDAGSGDASAPQLSASALTLVG
jgi:uncharacterized protein YndB with AHSA1/START domain